MGLLWLLVLPLGLAVWMLEPSLRRLLRRWLGLEAVEAVQNAEGMASDALIAGAKVQAAMVGRLDERISALERELDVEDASSISEATATTARRRRLWLEELSGQPLSEEEKRAWEAGL